MCGSTDGAPALPYKVNPTFIGLQQIINEPEHRHPD
jgi:hypothetical protein